MLVSWKWLQDYVDLDMPREELHDRLTMAGLNFEGAKDFGDDLVVDLEVTSNRPDCLGHLGVAREVAVLWEKKFRKPQLELLEQGPPADKLTKVRIDCPEMCTRYIARVIRGVKVGPSPDWLAARLEAIGERPINNVVDITNYVLFETGQPLHAFDFAKLAGGEIQVRRAKAEEPFEAINHMQYKLDRKMCVIADAQRAVALGGVMGGADTEVSEATTDLLIESAEFDPLTIRNASRKLKLPSPSSYRFERGVDPLGVDWASRRCCQLILQIAGGELAEGSVDVGQEIAAREPIRLRLSQIPRVLGIEITPAELRKIFTALGCEEKAADQRSINVVPPTWRRDLTREIDLIEEAARIHGYDEIPEDEEVPMRASHRTDFDRGLQVIRDVMCGCGYDEVMTDSMVVEAWAKLYSPWTKEPPIVSETPLLLGADRPRVSLSPSLLQVLQTNERTGNADLRIFETAKIYLPRPGKLPVEPWLLGLAGDVGFDEVKGVVETLVERLNPQNQLQAGDANFNFFAKGRGCQLMLDGEPLGWLGEISQQAADQFGLRGGATVAEMDIQTLLASAELVPQHKATSAFPPIRRDLNLVVDEAVRWSAIETAVSQSAGGKLQSVAFQEIFRDEAKDGPGKKRMLFSIELRSDERTLTGDEADEIQQRIVAACEKATGAKLLA